MIAVKVSNANEAYDEVLKNLYFNAEDIRNERTGNETKEILDFVVHMSNPTKRHILNEKRKMHHWIPSAEFCWYMLGTNRLEPIVKYLPRWANFSDDGETVNSNYGYTWASNLAGVVQQLVDDSTTRRAVLSIYNNSYITYKGLDTPCTCDIVFNIRENRLHMSVYMRSNDIVFGFSIDQWVFSALQELLCNTLVNVHNFEGLQVGSYTHHSVSMHIYDRHFDHIEEWKRSSFLHYVGDALDSVKPPGAIASTTDLTNFWQVKDPYFFSDKIDYDWFAQFLPDANYSII